MFNFWRANAVVLGCNNFRVIDLGVMVPCERILEVKNRYLTFRFRIRFGNADPYPGMFRSSETFSLIINYPVYVLKYPSLRL
jgi:hypothetical protein